MVFVRLRCKPNDEQVTLSVWITTSQPPQSLSKLNSPSDTPVLEIQIHIRCISSVRPDKPLTICTSGSILNTCNPEDGHMDSLARGMLGPGFVCTDASGGRKVVSLGYFRVHRARRDNDWATDLLERPDVKFITVPARDSGDVVTVTHGLSAERLFAYAEKMGPGDLRVGEKYSARLGDGYIGAMWWCWGGLDDALKGKKLHCFSEGFCASGNEERPSEEEVEREGWVTGENISQLIFKVDEARNTCSVEVIE
jgi:hypothetical protein